MESTGSSLLVLLLLITLAGSVVSRSPLVRAPRDAPTTGEYMVVAKRDITAEQFDSLLARVSELSDDRSIHRYVDNVGKVITVALSPYTLEAVRRLDGVDHIEEEDIAQGDSHITHPHSWPVQWHLDRLDQDHTSSHAPLDGSYQPIGTGEGVDVYVLDSGVKYDHSEFEFRAKFAGYDPYDAYNQQKLSSSVPQEGRDCHGHGTHVASLCGGKTFGTAKKVTIYSVRVLSCKNSAPWSVVLDGLSFVSKIIKSRMRPAVITMSLSGQFHSSVNDAVMELYKKNIPVVTVAGNGKNNCCTRSPASSSYAITVAGTRLGDGLYRSGSGTNFGECVDIFAPGEKITGASHICQNCSIVLSGTSMAAPMVAGIVAIHLAQYPHMSAGKVRERLINDSQLDVISFQGMPATYRAVTPNRFVKIPGSCGGSWFPRSTATFHTPMFPDQYLNNLNCWWSISAEENQQVKITFHTVNTERGFDVVKVYDGVCHRSSNVMATISGELGAMDVSFISRSSSICVNFKSDTTTTSQGFNATYNKLYRNTSITVVNPPLPRDPHSKPYSTKLLHHVDTKSVRKELNISRSEGYRPIWCNMFGDLNKGYTDLILTNETNVRSICLPEVGNKSISRILKDKAAVGYHVWHIATRTRGRTTIRPVFHLLLKPLPSHLEHVYYLRETENEYLHHLETNTALNYTLLSHSFYYLGNRLYVSSVYVRDRRLQFNIPMINSPPPKWRSFYNVSLSELRTVLNGQANQSFYPISINSYRGRDGGDSDDSLFSLVFQEKSHEFETWMQWGLNETSVVDTVTDHEQWFKPVLSAGYFNNASEEIYVQFERKHQFEL